MTNPFALDTPPAPAAAVTAPVMSTATGAPVVHQVAVPTPPAVTPSAPLAPGEDPFSGPAPRADRPRVRDMYGRLLLVIPHKLEEGIPNRLQPGTTQDRMTADVVVLDGGALPYGGRPEATPPVPHTKTAQVPLKVDRMFISQAGLISQSREALAKRLRGQPGMVLGRLAVGETSNPGQNAPYLLTPPTEEDKQLARKYLASVDPFA